MTPTPPESKADTTNPKDLLGEKKVSLTKLPAVAVLHGAHAMMNGAQKYGAYNWRDKKVVAHIYIDAALRHIEAWFEGEELASDSGVHHLGHALACCAILLDAQESGNLIDDRPVNEKNCAVFSKVLERLNKAVEARNKPVIDVPAVVTQELGWRLLQAGEVIQAGDEFQDRENGRWYDSSFDAGMVFDPAGACYLPRRRRVTPQ